VEKYKTNERGSSMTVQLAALEARIEAEHRADEAMRMQHAMKAVDFVSKWKPPHPATYGLRNKQIKANTGIWPESMQPCKDG